MKWEDTVAKEKPIMKLVFTSFRDSMELEGGLKLSIDRRVPKLCSYPTFGPLTISTMKNLTVENLERVIMAVLDNNWNLVVSFIKEMWALGIRKLVLCDWCTKEQIEDGKLCSARLVGEYLLRSEIWNDFDLEVEYRDGR